MQGGAAKGKENVGPNNGLNATARIQPSNEVKFSKMSGNEDMNLMIAKS